MKAIEIPIRGMTAIFISYRRDDTEGQAGRLFDDLVQEFGDASVFIDVTGIAAGRDFRRVIDQHVSSCDVLLAMIGKQWLGAKNEAGVRRIDIPTDFVRLEIAAALKRDIPVVPILVQKASMPSVDQLPPELQDLAYRNGLELTHARWDSDVQVLIKALRAEVGTKDLRDQEFSGPKVGATALNPASVSPPMSKPSVPRHYLLTGFAAVLVVIALVLGYQFRERESSAAKLVVASKEAADRVAAEKDAAAKAAGEERIAAEKAAAEKAAAEKAAAEKAAAERAAAEKAAAEKVAAEKERVERPFYRRGDTFTVKTSYRDHPEWNSTSERKVKSVMEEKVVWQYVYKGGKIRTVEMTPERNPIRAMGSSEDYSYSPPFKYFEFPLYQGKQWQQDTTKTMINGSKIKTKVSATVQGWEKITVPAGTFETIKIVITTINVSNSGNVVTGKDISWYAPTVRYTVKSIQSSEEDGKTANNETQLTGYAPGSDP